MFSNFFFWISFCKNKTLKHEGCISQKILGVAGWGCWFFCQLPSKLLASFIQKMLAPYKKNASFSSFCQLHSKSFWLASFKKFLLASIFFFASFIQKFFASFIICFCQLQLWLSVPLCSIRSQHLSCLRVMLNLMMLSKPHEFKDFPAGRHILKLCVMATA